MPTEKIAYAPCPDCGKTKKFHAQQIEGPCGNCGAAVKRPDRRGLMRDVHHGRARDPQRSWP